MERSSEVIQANISQNEPLLPQPQASHPNPVSLRRIYSFMLLMLVAGCANTILYKSMDQIRVTSTSHNYVHPYFQSMIMFSGESVCLLVYFLTQKSNQTEPNHKPKLKNVCLLGCPGLLDFCGSTLTFIALGLIPASIYQMLSGFTVVITCLFSFFFLHKPYFRHHWLGVILVTGGVILVGIAAVLFGPKEESSETSIVVGVVLLLLAQFFVATQFLIEAILFDRYQIHPLKLVGCEGLLGVAVTFSFITIFSYIPCPSDNFCEVPYDTFTSPIRAMTELVAPATILACALGLIVSIAFFNFSGVSVTKYSTAGHRAVIDTSRTVIIWIFFLALQQEEFIWLQLIGFMLLSIGSLVFNEVLRLPCWGLNLFTLEAMKSSESRNGNITSLMSQTSQTSSTSPPYQYQNSQTQNQIVNSAIHG